MLRLLSQYIDRQSREADAFVVLLAGTVLGKDSLQQVGLCTNLTPLIVFFKILSYKLSSNNSTIVAVLGSLPSPNINNSFFKLLVFFIITDN